MRRLSQTILYERALSFFAGDLSQGLQCLAIAYSARSTGLYVSDFIGNEYSRLKTAVLAIDGISGSN